jgi:hypothetical protein
MISFNSTINQKICFELPELARAWGLLKADHNSKITNPGGGSLRGFVFCAGWAWNG